MRPRSYLLVLALALAPTASFAAPMCSAGSLQSFLDMTNPCSIGDKDFSDFRYVGVTLLAVPAADINVTPIIGPDVGLRFTGPFSVSGINLVSETFFSFLVATSNGQPSITGAKLKMEGSFTGLGAVSLDENIQFAPLNSVSLNTRTSVISTQLADSVTFAPVSSMRVSKDIFLLSGVLGSSTIDSFEQTYQQIPEPATLGLSVGALAIFGCIRRLKTASVR